MALVWSCERRGVRYEVRSAGRSLRLYTDGVFHSQYHPTRPVTGGIWDLLYLPVHFLSHPAAARALVLGVGGGAVLRLLQRHAGCAEILGVERDAHHLRIARRFFGLGAGCSLVHADAVGWLAAQPAARFDFLVDDLFGGRRGEPVRAVPVDAAWCRTLARGVAPGGVLVINFASRDELAQSALLRMPRRTHGFRSAFRLWLPAYENAVAAFCRAPASSRGLRRRLERVASLALGRRGGLDYRIRQLW